MNKLLITLLVTILMMSIFSSVVMGNSGTTMLDTHQEDTDEDDTTTEVPEDETDEDDEVDDEDEIDEETEAAFEREVEVSASDSELEIRSELENGENEDSFEARFTIGSGDEPEIELAYATETNTSESELEYRVNFDEVIEFEESGDSPGYDGNDTVLSIYDLGQAEWQSLEYSTSETADGGTLHQATATTTDGVFVIKLYITGTFADLNGTVIAPNSVKIDIEIHDFPYQGNNSYLAIQTDVESESEFEVETESEDEEAGFSSDESQLSIGNENANGFFSWVEHAMADGQQIDVLNSGLLAEEEEDDDIEPGEVSGIIFFTFDVQNASDIVWDPKVGVVSQATQALLSQTGSDVSDGNTNGTLPAFNIWLVAMVFTTIAIFRFRRDD